ncbi:MAG: MogA/MoaB family molybdenum cofactor biosynthesis protein [Solirubrobacteraceae bacterium]
MSHQPHDRGDAEVVLRAAVLTVSSSVAAGDAQDHSGQALADAAAQQAQVVRSDVVADDQAAIEAWLRERVAEGIELIFTTGGTGLTPDDVTPEATLAVIDRAVPGIAEAMRAESLRHTPQAMLSRALAGSAKMSLIVNFPGSPSAISDLFPVLAPVLRHAVATLHRHDGHLQRQ